MNRLLCIWVLILVLPGWGLAAEQPQPLHWRLVTSWPKNLPGFGTGVERLAQQVERMSGGRLRITVYGAGELVPAFEVFDAVASGTAEMGHGAAYYWRGKIPATAMFTTVPFGMVAHEHRGWLSYGNGLELWRELYRPYDVRPFAVGTSGTQMFGWFRKRVRSVETLRGIKMRIPGLGGEFMERIGVVTVTLPGGEMFTAMQNGTLDAVEWNGPYNDQAFGLHQVAKYYYYPGWHEPGAQLELLVNASAWERLPDDLQAIVRVAAQSADRAITDEYTFGNSRALRDLQAKKVSIARMPDDAFVALYRATREGLEVEMANNADFARVYQSYRAYAEGEDYYRMIDTRIKRIRSGNGIAP